MPPRNLIVGMSHVEALRRAMTEDEAARTRVVNFSQEKLAALIRGPGTRLTRLTRIHRLLPRRDLLCFQIHGNFHNTLGLFNHPVPFVIGDDDLPGQRVPEGMMLELIRREHASHLVLARQVAAVCPAHRLVVLAPPPPIARAEHIRAFPGTFRQLLPLGVGPAATRIKLYRLQCRIHAEHAAALGAEFLPAPPEALTPAGFLAPRFAVKDPTHASPAYGRLVLDRLFAAREAAA